MIQIQSKNYSLIIGVLAFVILVFQPSYSQKVNLPIVQSEIERKLAGDLSVKQLTGSLLRVLPESQDDDLLLDIAVGHSFFSLPWVKPPASTTSRDGLGPLFNARNCIACHEGGGRGRAPDEGEPMRNMLVRLSVAGSDHKVGVVAESTYGTQLQFFGFDQSENGLQAHSKGVIGEASVSVSYTVINGVFADGETYQLKKPALTVTQLAYGKLQVGAMMSPRVGPSLVGMGLIAMIDQADIIALTDEHDQNGDGISGRANKVWSRENSKLMLGRFGLKANTPTLTQQVADAFVNDIGITSSVFPDENCGKQQVRCLKARSGKGPRSADEIDDEILAKVVTFVSHLPVPYSANKNTTQIKEGVDHFKQLGCQSCHHASFVTREDTQHPLLSKQKILPYSDFLLHDMGLGLADNRPDFLATGSEWRTAPLWGVKWRQSQGAFNNYLHDGRASSVEEAILWHGGEAELAKSQYLQLNKNQRLALLAFIESL